MMNGMRDAKTDWRKWIVVLAVAIVCVCPLVALLAIAGGRSEDPLARIAEEINSQGHSSIPGLPHCWIRVQSARMEDGCLILYGSNDPNGTSCVHIAWWPYMGSEGICTSRTVSIQRVFDPSERLKITFCQPARLPRIMLGRTQYVSIRRWGWIYGPWFTARDLLRSWLGQKPRNPGR